MAGKKGDSKAAAKKAPAKGGKEHAEKSADKGKSDPKKGKDDKKGGKGKEAAEKGKDAKKGKKVITSDESDEPSEAELEQSIDEIEESEELSEINEEENESEEEDGSDVPPPKGKKLAAIKGASKAMGGMKRDGHRKKVVQSEEEENEDEDEEEEDEKTNKRINLKGASKAMTGFKSDGKKAAKPAKKDLHLKGTSKFVMGLAADGKAKNKKKRDNVKAHLKGAMVGLTLPGGKKQKAEQEMVKKNNAKKGIKNTSKLFMGLGQAKQKITVANPNLKSTSKMFMGFGKKKSPFGKAKKQPVTGLKKTSRFMMGFKSSVKKPPPEHPGGPRKASFLLIRLGDKPGKNEKSEAAKGGLGNMFGKNKFGTKKTFKAKFKLGGLLMGKLSSTSNWLTTRFLSRRNKYRMSVKHPMNEVGSTAWLSKIGAQKLPFPSGDEVQRHRANMMNRYPAHAQNQYGYGYDFDDGEYDEYGRRRRSSYRRIAPPRPAWSPSDRYAYGDNQSLLPSHSEQYGYYEDELEYYYESPEQFGGYYEEVEYYDDGYMPQEQYGYYEDDIEYYDAPTRYPPRDYYDYYEDDTGYQESPYGYMQPEHYGYYEDEIEYYNSPAGLSPYEQYGYYEDDMEYDFPSGYPSPGQFGYYQDEMDYYQSPYAQPGDYDPYLDETELYNPYLPQDFGYQLNYSEYERLPYVESSYNQFGYPMSDIEEQEEFEETDESDYEGFGSSVTTPSWLNQRQMDHFQIPASLQSPGRQYKLFPRPQVKLFGRDKLEVARLPSPHWSTAPYKPMDQSSPSYLWDEESSEIEASEPFSHGFSRSPVGRTNGMSNQYSPRPQAKRFGQNATQANIQRPSSPRPAMRRFDSSARESQRLSSPYPSRLQYSPSPSSPQLAGRRFGSPTPSRQQRPQLPMKDHGYPPSPLPSNHRFSNHTNTTITPRSPSPKLGRKPFGFRAGSQEPTSPTHSDPRPHSPPPSPRPSLKRPVERGREQSPSSMFKRQQSALPPSPPLTGRQLGPKSPMKLFGQKPAAPNFFKRLGHPAPSPTQPPSPQPSIRRSPPPSPRPSPRTCSPPPSPRPSIRHPVSEEAPQSLPPKSGFLGFGRKAGGAGLRKVVAPNRLFRGLAPTPRPPSPQPSLRQNVRPPSPSPSPRSSVRHKAPGAMRFFGAKKPKGSSRNPFLKRLGRPKSGSPQQLPPPGASIRQQSIGGSQHLVPQQPSASPPPRPPSKFKFFGIKKNPFGKRGRRQQTREPSRARSPPPAERLEDANPTRPPSPQARRHLGSQVSQRPASPRLARQPGNPFLKQGGHPATAQPKNPFARRAMAAPPAAMAGDTQESIRPPLSPQPSVRPIGPRGGNPFMKRFGPAMGPVAQPLPAARQSVRHSEEGIPGGRSPLPSLREAAGPGSVRAGGPGSIRAGGQQAGPTRLPPSHLFGPKRRGKAEGMRGASGNPFLKGPRRSEAQPLPPSSRLSTRQRGPPGEPGESQRPPSPQPSLKPMGQPVSVRRSSNPPSPQVSIKQPRAPMTNPKSSYFASPQMKLFGLKKSPNQAQKQNPPMPLLKPFGRQAQPSTSPPPSPEQFRESTRRGSPGTRRVSFKQPTHSPAEASPSHPPAGVHARGHPSPKPSRLSAKSAARTEDEELAMEEPGGRYAVVLPRVHSIRYRTSLPRQQVKYHWSQGDPGRTAEVRNVYSPGRMFQQPPAYTTTRLSVYRQENVPGCLPQGYTQHKVSDQEWEEDNQNAKGMPWFNKMYSIGDQPAVRFQQPMEETGVDDMTQLEDLNEGTVLYNLRKRFDLQIIYTYIGSILVSMNPYKMYNLYGTETVLRYEGKSLGENPPHLFAIANAAFSKMIDAKHNQCIIISGESGSGKTEATKLILRYLAAIHHKRKDNATQQILEATPLLESFGNAKTVRNDNSSRFGKYIEIFLEDGVICGAITSQYLLEKSRIVFQAKNERNYHIFYELLAGLSSQQKQRFYLQEAETYYYLNQGGNCEIAGKRDGEDFRRLLSAMEVLGFSGEEQSNIFRILSSVLHLGNVYFEKYETDSQEIASVVSAREIRVVAELLQISPEGLQKSITYKVTETMREKIFTPLTVESAVDARDAVAKILYSLLFSWLTDRINKLVSPRTESLSIAILDIYGFEDLSINSFEQLCINYANEYLQYFFNKIIFKVEQEEYMREQIDWKEITFSDNQPCLDLISQRPHGILRVLDDQSCFPQATDHTFLQKCHYHHGSSTLYSKPKMPLPEFTIKHFAGKVTYQVHKFLEKNHDQVRQEVLELFVSSRTRMLAGLFSGHAVKAVPAKSSTITRRYQAPTVAAKFQQSLMELVEKMERCNPFFVRCFKPNNKKEMDLFELDLVSAQLRYSGMLETIRIRKEGFPVRIPFVTFIKRYKILLGITQEIKADGENCVTILKQICPVNKGMYRIGLTKLFMKENLHQILDCKRDRLMKIAALTLQRYARGFLARKHYTALRHKVILLQARARGYLIRKKYQKLKESLLKVRSVVRVYVNRRRFQRMREEAWRLAELDHQRMQLELTKREVVSVTHLDIPAELAGLLLTSLAQSEVLVGQVEPPKVQAEEQLTLVLDINNYPFSKFVRIHFKEPLFGMLTSLLEEPLTQVEDDLKQEAVTAFRLVLRFMGDPNLNGIQENLFGNYILQKGLANPGLRDEMLSQIANQVWRNTNKNNAERGWLLLATCLSCFAPSPKMDKYLLKFVSDHAHTGFKAMCQHRLMQALRKAGDGSDAARTYPPSLLEWTANKKGANMALHVSCLDGVRLLGPVNSWTTGEELAQDILRHRGAMEGYRGWSVLRKDSGEWAELAGHDYVMDLVSHLELTADFLKQKSYFLISSESPARRKANGNVVFGNGLDSDDDIPPFPSTKAPTELPPGTPDPDENYSGSLRQDLDCRSQKGLDRYLDSLFDPLLSYGNGDLEKTSTVTNQMKGGGKVGDGEEGSSGPEVQIPGGQAVMPMMPTMGAGMPGMQPLPVYNQNQFLSQQQAFINQQAYFLAQQMTVQALALQQQMTISSPSLTPGPSTPIGKLSHGNISPQTGAANGGLALTGVHTDTARGKPALNSSPTTPSSKPSALKLEPVHHTKLNTQHIGEPSHNIKDIIQQHQQPPEILRKEGAKVFAKKVDPHEEAMLILKGQLSPHLPQKSAPSLPQEKAAKETVAMVKPISSTKLKHSGPPVPAGAARHPALAGALISRELGAEDEMIQTQLHRPFSQDYYTYHRPAWELYIRKEVFYPKDNVGNPVLLDLIFRQILSDALSDTCVRISKEEQLRMRALLVENKIQASTPVKEEAVKRKIVLAARDVWEVYFSRLFPATGSVGTGVQLLAISHRGIHLLKLVRSSGATAENVKVLRSYSYTDVLFVTIPSKNMLEFNLTNEKLILFSSKAPQVKSMIDYFITELKKDSNYVVAVKSYMAGESSAMLSFHKGDIIRLQPMEGVEEGYCYGCIVRKKVVYMEELKRYTPDFGWKFGAFHGRSGLFPVEFVQPVAAPDFIHLSVDKKEEPKDKRGKVAVSSTVAAAVASTAAAEELDRKIEASERTGGGSDYMDDVISDSQYTMSEFASKYFREAHRLKGDYNKQKSKKGKDSRDPADMMKYTKSPIHESLIEFSDETMNKVAVEIFAAIMKFMGDSPLKGQTEQDAIYTVLKLCGEHEVMKDETYCQIIKQVTNNSSSKVDSSLRGWRMLYILCAHHKCSEVLKPYLYKFLEDICRSPGANFQGIAHGCEQNLRKTFQFGGRTQNPGGMELKAMLAGRSSKRQLFLLPGSVERHVKIKTCSVALDVIEELCYEMGLHSPEAVEEYSLFVITNNGQNVHPLNRKDYILDVATEMEAIDSNFTFWFRRLLWAQPLKFDNELCVTVHYNQVVPDYLKGLLHILTQERRSEQQFQQVSKLAALQHRAKDSVYLPSVREVQEYVPSQIYRQQRPQVWVNMVTDQIQQVQALSAHQARAQFLGLVSIFAMFGSSFFFIQSSSNSAIDTPCILAVNQNGLSFLNKDTHELTINFPLKEVQSTRTQRPATGCSYPYVEIQLGDLLSQRTTQLQLNQALDMCRVIAVHMESVLTAREKRLTLPPSEITLL